MKLDMGRLNKIIYIKYEIETSFMILSVSRRTDIPAFYSKWFFTRLEEGFCYVQNPMNPKLIQKVLINTDVVDAIVFWTKNPQLMLENLEKLSNYSYWFHITLTSYADDIERNVPKKSKVIESVIKLADIIGKERVIWRYDPILLNDKYTIDYHIKYFEVLAKKLCNSTEKVVISFIDFYHKISTNWNKYGLYELKENEIEILSLAFKEIAQSYGLEIAACCEKYDLSSYGINSSKCIDDKLLSRITGYNFNIPKQKGQRFGCGCVDSVDIGMYNSCVHDCKYCYATHSFTSALRNKNACNPSSALLFGEVSKDIIIKDKVQKSYKDSLLLLK